MSIYRHVWLLEIARSFKFVLEMSQRHFRFPEYRLLSIQNEKELRGGVLPYDEVY